MKFLLPLFLSASSLFAKEVLSKEELLSFYRGQILWKEQFQQSAMPYDLEQVIAGIRAAEKGEGPPCSKEELLAQVREFQEELLAKQTKENLELAEAFLAKIADESAIEIIPTKLYYKQVKAGTGRIVEAHHTPLLTYSMRARNPCGEMEIYSLDEPSYIELEETIPGFSYGVTGMREGEVRKLFIHPELAYGTYGKFEPNLLIIFEVEIIATDDECPLMENEDIF